MFIIALSTIFGYGIVLERIPETIAVALMGISRNDLTILLLIIMASLIVAGMFVDGSVWILMLTPIFLPIAEEVGFDPVHFGVVFVMTITMGNMTPPVGAAMYAGCTILDCSVQEYVAGRLGDITSAPGYASSKAGMDALTKTLARHLAPLGIRVNGVSPHAIETDMSEQWSEERRREIIASIPLGRLGRPEDVARAVLFFSSGDASLITGEILDVNGGALMD